jgi:hypothetical protein
MPISIRVGTNRPGVFLGGLAHSLAEITGKPVVREGTENVVDLKGIIYGQLDAIASNSERVLVVLDGLDEALQGTFDASIFPAGLPGSLRILVSARWQVGDIDSTGWLRRLGWDRNIRASGKFELQPLTTKAIVDVLLKLGAPTDVLGRNGTSSSALGKTPPYGMRGGWRKRRHHAKPATRLDPTRPGHPLHDCRDAVAPAPAAAGRPDSMPGPQQPLSGFQQFPRVQLQFLKSPLRRLTDEVRGAAGSIGIALGIVKRDQGLTA